MTWCVILVSALVIAGGLVLVPTASTAQTPSSDVSSPVSCAGASQPLPSWLVSCDRIDFSNYTLPALGLGYQVIKDDYNAPIVTTNLTDDDLMAYYLNVSGSLVQYNLNTSTYSVLEPAWINLTAWNAPQTLFPYIDPAGQVTMLYTTGAWSTGGMGAEEYWLTNGTFVVNHNASIPNTFDGLSGSEVSASVCDHSGDIAFGNRGTNGTIYVLNIWSPTGSLESRSFDDGFVGWSSWDYYPTVNTVVENENVNITDPQGGSAALWMFQFNVTTHTIVQRELTSEPQPFIVGDDTNDQAYFYETLPNGTTLGWGIGVNDGRYTLNATFHTERYWLYPDIELDTWESVDSTGLLGTTDQISGAIPDAGGYYLNGFNMGLDNSSTSEPAPNDAASHQSLFLNPLDDDEIYANNSPWLNHYVTTEDMGYNGAGFPNDVASSYEYIGPNDTTGAFLQPGGSNLTVFWLVGVPGAPDVSVSVEQRLSVAVNWADPPTLSGLSLGSSVSVWTSAACAGPVDATFQVGPEASTLFVVGLSAYRVYGFAVVEKTPTGLGPRSICSPVEVYPINDLVHEGKSLGLPAGSDEVSEVLGAAVVALGAALGGSVAAVSYLRGRRGRSDASRR